MTNIIDTAVGTGEAPAAAGAPPLTTRSVDRVVDTNPAPQLLEGAAALTRLDGDGLPTDVRDTLRAASGYARLVARHLTEVDARLAEDLIHLGDLVVKHAALTRSAADGRPRIRMACAAARWLVFAAQYPLVTEFPNRPETVRTAVQQCIDTARAAAAAPDTDIVMVGVL